jgi:hypothetical protein
MYTTKTLVNAVLLVLLLIPSQHAKHSSRKLPAVGSAPAVLWRQPEDIKSRDLFFGAGGPEHAPKGKLEFIEENLHGTQPKFFVRDSDNVRWGVKIGPEARVETAATRLLWAVGYFADEEYYLAELPLNGHPQLLRGRRYSERGKAVAVRLKRYLPHSHKIGNWRWDSNPFVGTRELNGLKVMMELFNNTDFKTEHLVIYEVNGTEQHYVAKDLGASFGRANAGYFNRTKGSLKDYERFNLIRKSDGQYVDFWYFKQVPRADARWIGELVAQLSDKQIGDAFRAGEFSPQEVEKRLRSS